MRRMYADDGRELAGIFQRAKAVGTVTSLDMAVPDPASAAGKADWRAVLHRALPFVDLFLPSLDEIRYMVPRSDRTPDTPDPLHLSECTDVAQELLAMGPAVVALKLGENGLYVRTSPDPARLTPLRLLCGDSLDSWRGRELYCPAFRADVVGTTGCGDCAIAAFLAALLRSLPVEQAVTAAAAAGACAVERADAVSGLVSWQALQDRITAGRRRDPLPLEAPAWSPVAPDGTAHGPNDRSFR